MTVLLSKSAALLITSLSLATAAAQSIASSYNAAAQSWTSAAASCHNPVAVACMARNASYYRCLASQLVSGASVACSRPSCSTSCPGSSMSLASKAASSSSMQKLEKDAGIGMAVFSAFKLLSKAGDNTAASQVPAELTQEQIAAQQAAQQQQQINNDAANILNSANTLMAENAPPNLPDPNTSTSNTVAGLLDDAPPPADTSSTVASLLGDTSTPDPTTTDTISNLLGDAPTPAPPDANVPDADNPGPDSTDPATSALTPTDPGMNAAQAASEDPPVSPSTINTLQPEADVPNPPSSVVDAIQDGLQNIVNTVKDTIASAQATLSSMMNSPIGQLYSGLEGIRDGEVPDPLSTDTGDEMADKITAQSFLGFSKLFNTAPWTGVKNYTYSMINKGSEAVGFAAVAP